MSGLKATISYKLVNGYIEAATRVAVSPGELDAIVEARRLNFPRLPLSSGEKKRGEILSWQILILSEIHLALCVRNKKYAKEIATLKNNAKLLISAIAGYVAAAVGAVEAIIAALVAAMLRIVLINEPVRFLQKDGGIISEIISSAAGTKSWLRAEG
jgi:hypothetical protein